jgi:hypothetical protein
MLSEPAASLLSPLPLSPFPFPLPSPLIPASSLLSLPLHHHLVSPSLSSSPPPTNSLHLLPHSARFGSPSLPSLMPSPSQSTLSLSLSHQMLPSLVDSPPFRAADRDGDGPAGRTLMVKQEEDEEDERPEDEDDDDEDGQEDDGGRSSKSIFQAEVAMLT